MDEPSAALTDQELGRLFRIIGSLKRRGVAVIYISHMLEEVFQIADGVTVLKDGPSATSPTTARPVVRASCWSSVPLIRPPCMTSTRSDCDWSPPKAIGVFYNIMNLLNVNAYLQIVLKGVVLILAVSFYAKRRV
jgi:energy-coupling factor transporter ATP-binding protein EcfA2